MGREKHAAAVVDGDPKGIHTFHPDRYVVGFQETDETQVAVVGGKGAHLGELRGSKASACRPDSA